MVDSIPMPAFGRRSEQNLRFVDPRLLRVARQAIEIYNFTVLEGARTEERQRYLISIGASALKDPTRSKHVIPGWDGRGDPAFTAKAIDVAPWHSVPPRIRWKDHAAFHVLAGVMLACAHREGVCLRWGGDWDGDGDTLDQTFNDLGHFELEED